MGLAEDCTTPKWENGSKPGVEILEFIRKLVSKRKLQTAEVKINEKNGQTCVKYTVSEVKKLECGREYILTDPATKAEYHFCVNSNKSGDGLDVGDSETFTSNSKLEVLSRRPAKLERLFGKLSFPDDCIVARVETFTHFTYVEGEDDDYQSENHAMHRVEGRQDELVKLFLEYINS